MCVSVCVSVCTTCIWMQMCGGKNSASDLELEYTGCCEPPEEGAWNQTLTTEPSRHP